MHVGVNIVESMHSLQVAAAIVDHFESVGTAVVQLVFVCLAVAGVCGDMNSACCHVFDIVNLNAA